MQRCITFTGMTAVRIIRAMRAEGRFPTAPVYGLGGPCAPVITGSWWTRARLIDALASVGLERDECKRLCIDVAVPAKEYRLRTKGVRNHVYELSLPSRSFVSLGGGVYAASPELLYVELSRRMGPLPHLLLGMELCGTYARNPYDPWQGETTYWVEPLTSACAMTHYVDAACGVRGVMRARHRSGWLLDNAWSPMEALLAGICVMPYEELGFNMQPIQLNKRVRMPSSALLETRVPDIMFSGTSVGFNYDGSGHDGLKVIEALLGGETDLCNEGLKNEVRRALRQSRQLVVSDKRRDRDLSASGRCVLPVTKEDFFELGALEHLVLSAIDIIEHEGSRDLSEQRRIATNRTLALRRHRMVLSALRKPDANVEGTRPPGAPKRRIETVIYEVRISEDEFILESVRAA